MYTTCTRIRSVVALSVGCRTCNQDIQEVVGSSLGRARGVKTLGMFLTSMCLCSLSSTSWCRPKGGDALRLGSIGRYGLCVWVAGKTVRSPCYTRAISERLRGAARQSAIQIQVYFTLGLPGRRNEKPDIPHNIFNCTESR